MDFGIPVELVTPRGTLTFNGFDNDAVDGFVGEYLRLTSFEGVDFPTLRTPVQPKAQADGDILFDFWRSGRYPSIQGQVKADSAAGRTRILERLRDHLNSIVRADGTLRWVEPSAYAEAVLALAPNQYYRLGGTTAAEAAKDYGSSGQDGAFTGAWTHGVPGLILGGSADRASALTVLNRQFASPTGITDTSGAQSMAWLVSAAAGQGGFFNSVLKSAGVTGWQVQRRSGDDGIQVRVDTSGGANQIPVQTALPVYDGTPHLIVLVLNTGSAELYLDGILVSSGAYVHGTGFANNTTPLRIGGTSGSNQILGTFDELARWQSKALNKMEVATLARAARQRKQLTVRAFEPLQVGSEPVVKSFRVGLVTGDAYACSDVERNVFKTASAWTVTVDHVGTGEGRPKVRLTGSATPVTAVDLKNDLTGKFIRLTGLNIGAGQYVEVDMAARTIKDQAGTNLISKMTAAVSEFWTLSPVAEQTISATTLTGTPSRLDVFYRDSWVA